MEADKTFSAEEGHGRYLDLHRHYMNFCNIKKLRKADDYLSWLQHFDKFSQVPLYVKQSKRYEEYLEELADYLIDFFKRTQPLLDFDKSIKDPTEEMFESEWQNASLFGWESVIVRY